MDIKRSVLITGSSTGIGKACALHLDSLGYIVYAGVRTEKDKEALSSEASGRLNPIILDVTKEDTVAEAARIIAERTEYPLCGLINNAGVGFGGILEATPTEDFRKMIEVNLIGLHSVTQAMLPLLRNSNGRIINIGSMSSYLAGPGASSYAASKFAVRAITDALRLELKPLGISVSLVAPGAVESDIWEKAAEYKKKLRKKTSKELLDSYRMFIDAGERMVQHIKPIPAMEVVKAVTHGLTSRKPKRVYIVGSDAKKAYQLSRLPKGIADWLILAHVSKLAKSPGK